MAKEAHTPGPWSVDGPKPMSIECRVHRIVNPAMFPAAFVPAWDRPGDGEEDGTIEAIANARLIAAAPELLEALVQVKALAEHGSYLREIAEAAIAKVRGETA
ncbi:hypothetical protein CMI47_05315 [Candidatus Pacearchaeota archaeon]|nr:hypothetical protein [Candidatus Pacearchaeota archaeon]